MKRFILTLLAATALVSPSFAADDPQRVDGANDSRIRTVDYSTKIVTRITSTNLVPITLVYGDGQIPKMIAGLKVVDVTMPENGDAKAKQEAAASAQAACRDWCALRHSNQITLQPVRPDAGSMLAVTTERRDDDGKVVPYYYAYELMTRTGIITDALDESGKVTKAADTQSYFIVQYTYRSEDAAKKAAAWRAAHPTAVADAMKAKVDARLATSKFGVPTSHQWFFNDSVDCKALGPDRVSDNGQQTAIHFRMNAPVSIPNIVDDEGQEHLAQHANDVAPDSGLLLTIFSVPGRLDPKQPAIVLRRDKQVCGLYNFGFNPNASVPNTGTSAPDVVRETRK